MAFVAIAMFLLCSAGPARAQDEQDQPDQGTAPADTVTASSDQSTILHRMGLRPIYNSTVDVNRTKFGWTQGLKLDRSVERLKLLNTWSIAIQKDAAVQNYKSRAGDAKARGEYAFPGLGGWSTGADLALRRNFTRTDLSRTVNNSSIFSWFLTAGAPGRALSALMGLPEGALSWDWTGSTGATDAVDIRENRTQAGGTGRADSTHATGNTEQLVTRLAASAGTAWKLDMSGQLDQDREDSRTRQRDTSGGVGVDSTVAGTNRNRGQRASFNTAWTPNPQNRIGLTGLANRTVNQNYSADVRAQDTKTGLDQRVALDAKTTPFLGINFDMSAETKRTDIAYTLSTQGRGQTRNAASGKMNFTVSPAIPLLRGTESTTEANWERSNNTFKSSVNYKNEITSLRQNLRRPFGTRVVAVATGEASLNRALYAGRTQDRDDLRYLLDGALNYRPQTGIDCRLIGQWRQQKTVYIPAANSRNSVTAKSYAVGAELALQLNPAVRVSQKYTMTADYSFYDFNENSNALRRTTEVRTGLQSTIGEKAKLTLDHSFSFKDSGEYRRVVPGAPRLYAKARDETYQLLTVTTEYAFTPGFILRASQRMEVRENRTRGGTAPAPVRTQRLDFTGGLDLNHRFSDDFSVNTRVDRTQSSVEKSYWRVQAGLNRAF